MTKRRRHALALLLAAAPALAQETPEPVLGAGSAIAPPAEADGAVLLEAGTRVRREPDPRADPLTLVDAPIEVTPLEVRGAWIRVRYADVNGWVLLGEAEPDPTMPAPAPIPPPAETGAKTAAPSPPAVDPERLERALALLRVRHEPDRAGPFAIYSDLPAGALRASCLRVASVLEDGYRERFGLAPVVDQELAVVLFAAERAYRAYADLEGGLSDLGAPGHAGHGIAALTAEGRNAGSVLSLLVHELTHLLNRFTLGGEPPPWLEEGMANDLAFSRLDRDGRLRLGTLGGETRLHRNIFLLEGPIASLSQFQRAAAEGRVQPLEQLTDLTWREFVQPEGRGQRYIASAFLVRYLLDGERGTRAEAFRRYLGALAAGRTTGSAALLTALGARWIEIERGYLRWVRTLTGIP